jgi:hypothetical protein
VSVLSSPAKHDKNKWYLDILIYDENKSLEWLLKEAQRIRKFNGLELRKK